MNDRRRAWTYLLVGVAAFAFGMLLGTPRKPVRQPEFPFAQRIKREYKLDGKTMTRTDYYEVAETNPKSFFNDISDALDHADFWNSSPGSLAHILEGFDSVGGPSTAFEAHGTSGQDLVFDHRGPEFYFWYTRPVTGVEKVYGWLRLHA